jgi:hypothetical protein
LLCRFLCNFIKHFQVFCAFFIHLFLGFRIYPPMQSIRPIIHYSSCLARFFVSICAFFSFTFPPSLYLYDLVSLLLLVSWLEFLPRVFSIASLCLFLSSFKHLLYFHLFLFPFLSLFLCTSLSSTLSPSIFLFVPMFICFSQSFYFYLSTWFCVSYSLQLLIILCLCDSISFWFFFHVLVVVICC